MNIRSIWILSIAFTMLIGTALVGCGKGGPGGDANEALFEAAKAGNLEAAKKAIAAGADVKAHAAGSSEIGDEGHTALHYAAERGYNEVVQFLLDSGADIEAKNGFGNTPLLLAINFTMTDTVMLLLKNGADIKAKNSIGKGAIAHARKGRPSEKTLDLLAKVEAAGAPPEPESK